MKRTPARTMFALLLAVVLVLGDLLLSDVI